jgi:hypothetical protein
VKGVIETSFLWRSIGLALALGAAVAAGEALAKRPSDELERYGIKGVLRSYDAGKHELVIQVTDNKASSGRGAGLVGGPAPDDVKVGSEMRFAVRPTGALVSRTVIKGSKGTSLDNSGTEDGFRAAVQAIPSDRPILFSLVKVEKPAPDGPQYEVRAVVVPLSDAEWAERLKQILVDEEEPEQPAEPEKQ